MLKRFREKLAQQILFIENSCAAYDRGQHEEAIRIGTSLRVLLHDSVKSTSLLSHLQVKDVQLLSTCEMVEPIRYGTFFDSFSNITFSSSGISFQPKLETQNAVELPSDQWWLQSVIGFGDGRNLSRKMIALTAANKDGGAHVDDELPDEYALPTERVWARFDAQGTSPIVSNHHLLYLRQMGFEIVNSPQLRVQIDANA